MTPQSKKGFTLVEVLAAIIILALVTTGILAGLGFSQKMVLTNSAKDAHAAQVQQAADIIIARINDSQSIYDIAEDMNYLRINPGESFITEEDRIQFIAEENFNGSDLCRITIALFFDTAKGRDSVEMVCFAFHGDINQHEY